MLQQIINTMNEFIRIRVSSEDKEYLKDEANNNKMTLSAYVRSTLLKRDVC
jgi:hypothetical protein